MSKEYQGNGVMKNHEQTYEMTRAEVIALLDEKSKQMVEMQKDLDFKQKVIEELTNSRNKLRKEKILERKNNDLVNRLEIMADFVEMDDDQKHAYCADLMRKAASEIKSLSQK